MSRKHAAGESMTAELITIDWNEGLKTAYERMKKHRIRHLPVRNDAGEIVGMLSDRDVQRAMISEVRHDGTFSEEKLQFDPEARVRDYMGWPVLAIDQQTELALVAERMLSEKISAFLVQNEGGRTIGIITTDDLLKVLIHLLADPKASARWTLRNLIDEGSFRLSSVGI